MIVGVALVVDELHKGQRLVCRYPECVPSAIFNTDINLLKFHNEYLNLRCKIGLFLRFSFSQSLTLLSLSFVIRMDPKSRQFCKVVSSQGRAFQQGEIPLHCVIFLDVMCFIVYFLLVFLGSRVGHRRSALC